ncbi:MAG: chemotaxis protein [Xanthobacteraceae bacterium]|nr:chemotaxis protein [Xanthobacteraceae bacterium]QYK45507.1 MAG: chemotaxis protein [Xanthobacteraceae bacterium]
MPIFNDHELEQELRKIADYIVALRKEIGVLQANEIHLRKIPAAGEELAGVVNATEGATNEIMRIAESVLACGISEPDAYKSFVEQEMMALFEACAFQDLTGQRIGRVVKTLEQIETRVSRFANYTRIADETGFASEHEEKMAARDRDLLLSGPGESKDRNAQSAIDDILEGLRASRG